jgi:predicted GIY-YIG superfamily endonuclease
MYMYVYLLRSVERPDKTYIGATGDLGGRLEDHNQGRSHHTARFRPWRLEVSIWFADDTKAWAFERYLKRGSGHAFARRHF